MARRVGIDYEKVVSDATRMGMGLWKGGFPMLLGWVWECKKAVSHAILGGWVDITKRWFPMLLGWVWDYKKAVSAGRYRLRKAVSHQWRKSEAELGRGGGGRGTHTHTLTVFFPRLPLAYKVAQLQKKADERWGWGGGGGVRPFFRTSKKLSAIFEAHST